MGAQEEVEQEMELEHQHQFLRQGQGPKSPLSHQKG